MNKLMRTLFASLTGVILIANLVGCSSDSYSNNYVTEDVRITGTVTKQYITETYYYTVVDYGGDNPKVVENYDYYIKHNVGDEVELIKHRTYDENGNWISTTVSWK